MMNRAEVSPASSDAFLFNLKTPNKGSFDQYAVIQKKFPKHIYCKAMDGFKK